MGNSILNLMNTRRAIKYFYLFTQTIKYIVKKRRLKWINSYTLNSWFNYLQK